MAQSRGQRLIDQLPDVDLVVGTQKFHRTADYLDEIFSGGREKIVETWRRDGQRSHDPRTSAAMAGSAACPRLSASCKAATSIARFASFPYTRGEERSRTIADIVAECRELVLARRQGNHLARPDRHQLRQARHPERGNGRSAFVQLLDAVHEIDGLERIRFTSPHPKGYGDDLVEAYARLPKLCESAHLPVQSGSDRVLKLMHRGYTRERFLGHRPANCATSKPAIGITTDIIVGFPGETEEDFEETLSLAREAQFDNAYHFQIFAAPRHSRCRRFQARFPTKSRNSDTREFLMKSTPLDGGVMRSKSDALRKFSWKGRAGPIPPASWDAPNATKSFCLTVVSGTSGS